MLYIHHTACISPQKTFGQVELDDVIQSDNNLLKALEPDYDTIPPGLLRRMGKAVRLGIGTGLELLKLGKVNGIVVGTSNGGLEDSVKFLNQIIDYEEGRLTPTNFVQSTPNAIAAQIGLMSQNKGYNITHTHRGLAFENALLDVDMLLSENSNHTYLLGGIDEISPYNYAIEKLGEWYKHSTISNSELYQQTSSGSLAGEGAAMFLVNKNEKGTIGKILGFKSLHTNSIDKVIFMAKQLLFDHGFTIDKVDLFITGENGDSRHLLYYEQVENLFAQKTSIVRYKHLTGEYPTSSAFALWLTTYLFAHPSAPAHLYKRHSKKECNIALIYNHYKGEQHSLMLLCRK